MSYKLRSDVSFCRLDDTVIFLDLAADRYFALPASSSAAFLALIEGADLSRPQAASLGQLVECGILGELDGPEEAIIPTALCGPTRSLLDEPSQKCPSPVLMEALVFQTLAAHRVRTTPLRTVIAALATRKRQMKSRAAQSALEMTQWCGRASETLRLLISSQDRCLGRSLALANHLARKGCPFSLVFGVKLHPFGAHAWVQQGDLVLNSRLDEVLGYTPILVA